MAEIKRHWLHNPWQEIFLIMAPAILPVFLVIAFSDYFQSHEVSTGWWILLVLCVDVGHVYSTLFRLYWDPKSYSAYGKLLIAIPVTGFAAGFALHLYEPAFFWRILAYFAAFHFVRQQYGFMRLYSRHEQKLKWSRLIDALAIYNATLYPLLYWHVHATGKLAWFIKGDFVNLHLNEVFPFITYLYWAIVIVYAAKEIYLSWRDINVPKNLIVFGTYLSWYVGIVFYQTDLIFTLLNVVAHGIPYMALIWLYGKKKKPSNFSFNVKGLAIFAAVLLSLAYVEEFMWDGFVWNDHPEIFPSFVSTVSPQHSMLLSGIVALLVLPQLTHYVLDGFIWRFSKDSQARL